MPKTYIPEANELAAALHRYLTRYQVKLTEGVLEPPTVDQLAALASLIACVVTFLQEWPKPPPDLGP